MKIIKTLGTATTFSIRVKPSKCSKLGCDNNSNSQLYPLFLGKVSPNSTIEMFLQISFPFLFRIRLRLKRTILIRARWFWREIQILKRVKNCWNLGRWFREWHAHAQFDQTSCIKNVASIFDLRSINKITSITTSVDKFRIITFCGSHVEHLKHFLFHGRL